MLICSILISTGMVYLHNLRPKIIHRDLKSHNILMTVSGVAKITDFSILSCADVH